MHARTHARTHTHTHTGTHTHTHTHTHTVKQSSGMSSTGKVLLHVFDHLGTFSLYIYTAWASDLLAYIYIYNVSKSLVHAVLENRDQAPYVVQFVDPFRTHAR